MSIPYEILWNRVADRAVIQRREAKALNLDAPSRKVSDGTTKDAPRPSWSELREVMGDDWFTTNEVSVKMKFERSHVYRKLRDDPRLELRSELVHEPKTEKRAKCDCWVTFWRFKINT